jgi:tetrahydromethanopterin S-methyltransferase subunit G
LAFLAPVFTGGLWIVTDSDIREFERRIDEQDRKIEQKVDDAVANLNALNVKASIIDAELRDFDKRLDALEKAILGGAKHDAVKQ